MKKKYTIKEEMDKIEKLYEYRKSKCWICKHPIYAHINIFNTIFYECAICYCKFYRNEVYKIEVIGVEI